MGEKRKMKANQISLAEKIRIIDILTEKYFIERWNPLLNWVLKICNMPRTKVEMKWELIKKELKYETQTS